MVGLFLVVVVRLDVVVPEPPVSLARVRGAPFGVVGEVAVEAHVELEHAVALGQHLESALVEFAHLEPPRPALVHLLVVLALDPVPDVVGVLFVEEFLEEVFELPPLRLEFPAPHLPARVQVDVAPVEEGDAGHHPVVASEAEEGAHAAGSEGLHHASSKRYVSPRNSAISARRPRYFWIFFCQSKAIQHAGCRCS